MKKLNVADTVGEFLTPRITALGYRLWDVTYKKIGTEWHLEITIDNDEGITIDDCELVHRAIDPLLDELDPIEEPYHLSVSSPGIERELRTDAHILAFLGELVELRLFAPQNGAREHKGQLCDYKDGVLTLQNASGRYDFERDAISKITTVFFD